MYIYKCGELTWLGPATIGYNAPPGMAYNHPLTTGVTGDNIRTDEIACLHEGSEWSNVIIDLEESNIILGMTPEPGFATGTSL